MTRLSSYWWSPQEEAVLAPYVHDRCPWEKVMALLPGRTFFGAEHKLNKMRAKAGTTWRIPTDFRKAA